MCGRERDRGLGCGGGGGGKGVTVGGVQGSYTATFSAVSMAMEPQSIECGLESL